MLGKFHTLYLEATRECNFNCKYCSSGSNGKYGNENELSFDEIKNKILIPANKLGTKYIEFSGGEFLLREDAFELLEVANDLNFRIGIASNGSTLNDKTINKLKKLLGRNLLISLGVNSFDKTNKDTRFVNPDYTLKIINKLESENINMNICVTMGKFNADTFASTIKNIREFKLPHNRIPFVPRNCQEAYDLMFDKDTMKNKLHPVLRKYYHGYVSYVPFFLSKEKYENISGQVLQENKVPTNPSIGCWVGSFYAINPVGDVAPCPLLADNVSGGNVREQKLFDILYKSELFTKIIDRNKFKGKCGNCKYTYTCGGCRAYTYYLTGDIYGSDPTCFIDDLEENEISEIEKQTEKNFKNYLRMAKFGGLYE